MFRSVDRVGNSVLCCGMALALLAPLAAAQAKSSYKLLYVFTGKSNSGATPSGGLVRDQAGNLYGATDGYRAGNVFKLAPDGTETVLYSFRGGSDGALPIGALLTDNAGNLYGTTIEGGGTGCLGQQGCGTVFKLAPDGNETVLYAFQGGSDGNAPSGSLISDAQGNLYGTTTWGGGTGCSNLGCGSVFEIAPSGTETVLHPFTGGSDGEWPGGGVIADSAGNLYGTTQYGGGTGCGGPGCGTVFKLAAGSGSETILYAFTGGNDGEGPVGSLIADSAGNLYGTTGEAGTYGFGNVFKIAPDGSEIVLYAFQHGRDGWGSAGSLILDASGNLYGTTAFGGKCKRSPHCGTVFKLAPNGQEKVLHDFVGKEGLRPNPGLIADTNGNLYGTTSQGGGGCFGQGCGVVFTLKE